MIDFLPPIEHRIVVDDNSDYYMVIDSKSIAKEVYTVDKVMQTYDSAWVYVLYTAPYIPYTLDEYQNNAIAFNKYKLVVNCDTYQSVFYTMYNYDSEGNVVMASELNTGNNLQQSDFSNISKGSIGDIQAKIMCEALSF